MPPSPDLDPDATQDHVVLGGRYVLGPLLGRGGAADVHHAVDRMLDRPVAVKLLRESADGHAEHARFVAEAKTLARLTHPGLVGLLDAGLEHERPYFVMDLVTGGTLRDMCRGPRVDRGWAARIGAQVADALAAVHAAGVVHRDVKPSNILLDGDRTRLADFGIARLLSDPARHTRTGMAVGTAAYLAPEQVTGDRVTTAADVYSLGLVLLELLSGERAYDGTPVEAAVARLHQRPVLPHDLSAGWQSLLVEMTAIDPLARPTAAEVALRLRAVAGAYAAADREEQTAAIAVSPLTAATEALGTLRPAARTTGRRPVGAVLAGAAATVLLVALGVTAAGVLAPDEPAVATTDEDRTPAQIPDGVPAELRDPLADLHRAVRG